MGLVKKARPVLQGLMAGASWCLPWIVTGVKKIWSILPGLATVVIAIMTCFYVQYSKELAQIEAMGRAPRVTITPHWPRGKESLSFVFTNVGNSSAYNVTIAANTILHAPEAHFDPFKSAGSAEPLLKRVDALAPGQTAGYYDVGSPTESRNIYFYGTCSYQSRVPEIPKKEIKFCYLARDSGTVEPCLRFHIISRSISIRAKGSVGFAVQVVTPTPTGTRRQQGR